MEKEEAELKERIYETISKVVETQLDRTLTWREAKNKTDSVVESLMSEIKNYAYNRM